MSGNMRADHESGVVGTVDGVYVQRVELLNLGELVRDLPGHRRLRRAVRHRSDGHRYTDDPHSDHDRNHRDWFLLHGRFLHLWHLVQYFGYVEPLLDDRG